MFYLIYKIICQKTACLLFIQLALLSSFFQVFIVLGIYGFECSNLHSGLYWMGAMHPATPVHGHARYISRVVKYKKKVFSNICHHFSCLLDEEIAEILSILLLVVDNATDSITAKPCIQQDK